MTTIPSAFQNSVVWTTIEAAPLPDTATTTTAETFDYHALSSEDKVYLAVLANVALSGAPLLKQFITDRLPLNEQEQKVYRMHMASYNTLKSCLQSNSLLKIPVARTGIVRDLVKLALTDHGYDARHRSAVRAMCSVLCVPDEVLCDMEGQRLVEVLVVSPDNMMLAKVAAAPTSRPAYIGAIVGFTIGFGALALVTGGLFLVPLVFGGAASASTAAGAGAATVASIAAWKATAVTTCGLIGAGFGAYKAIIRRVGCGDFEITPVGLAADPASLGKALSKDPTKTFGLTVPLRLRNTVLNNFHISTAGRISIGLAIDNRTKEVLTFHKFHFDGGLWHRQPPQQIDAESSGVFMAKVCVDAEAGIAGICAYDIGKSYRIVLRYVVPPHCRAPSAEVSVFITTVDEVWEDSIARSTRRLTPGVEGGFQSEDIPFEVKWTGTISKVFTITPSNAFALKSRVVLLDEHLQSAQDLRSMIQSRRHIIAVLNNRSKEDLTLESFEVTHGAKFSATPFPEIVPQGHAGLVGAVNTPYMLTGAGVKMFYRITDVTLGLWAHVSGGGKVWACGEIHAAGGKLSDFQFNTAESGNALIKIPEGSTYVLTWEIKQDGEHHQDASEVGTVVFSFMEIDEAKEIHQYRPNLCIGITGFLPNDDPRLEPHYQFQALLGGPFKEGVMARPMGLYGCETYCIQWESDRQFVFDRIMDLTGSQEGDGQANHSYGCVAVEQGVGGILNALQFPHEIAWRSGALDAAYRTLQYWSVDAGEQLAKSLIGGFHGRRPVSLVATSTGAGVVLQCLRWLSAADEKGIIEDVFILGGAIPSNVETWQLIRTMTSGRVVNVYSTKDWMLTYLSRKVTESDVPLWMLPRGGAQFRAVSGLCPIQNVPGVENIDVSHLVTEHRNYTSRFEEILAAVPNRPTEKSLDGNTSSEGVVVPVRRDIYKAAASVYNSVTSRSKATFVLENRTLNKITLGAHRFHEGRWAITPPAEIEKSTAGILMVVDRPGEDPFAHIAISYKLGDSLYVTFWVSSNATGAEIKGSITKTPIDVSLPDPTDPEAYVSELEHDKLIFLKDTETGIVHVAVVSTDEGVEKQYNTLLGARHWDYVQYPPTYFPSATNTEALQALSQVPITPEQFEAYYAHRLNLIIYNQTANFNVNYVTDKLPRGEWRFVPQRFARPTQYLTCGLLPTLYGESIEGTVVVQVCSRNTEDCVALIAISVQLEWCKEVQGKLVVLPPKSQQEIQTLLDKGVGGAAEGSLDRGAKEQKIVARVDIRNDRNGVVVMIDEQ